MLGDMLELGEDSTAEHETVVNKALNSGACLICLVGNEFEKAISNIKDSRIRHFSTSSELSDWLENEPIKQNTILIKGSRGTKMEKIVEKL